jgi:hypothetical protein
VYVGLDYGAACKSDVRGAGDTGPAGDFVERVLSFLQSNMAD